MQRIAESGAEFLVLEITSHALAQNRIYGVPIEIAVMTNVTHEHLDYHKTFKNYRDAKRKLFKVAKYGVINEDDESWSYFASDVDEYITYGINGGILKAEKIELAAEGVKYEVKEADEKLKIRTHIPGKFTVYNSLAATAVGLKLGLTKKQIEDGILALVSVEGRMNRVNEGQDFEVIVDYAHTPDAFIKVFESVVPSKRARIISLFGGAGRRDESTRAERGEIGAKNSDIVIITEDDSRDEDRTLIAEEFARGAEKAGKIREKDLFVILDREEAIEKAISLAKKDDIVLVLGKGHEKTILRAEGAVPFEDLKVVRKVLKKMAKK